MYWLDMPSRLRQLFGHFNIFAMLRRPSIGRELALSVLVFSSLVTLAISLVQLNVKFKSDVLGIEQMLDQIPKSYSNSLSNSLWVTSQNDVQLQLDGIIRLPNMQYLEIRSDQDEVVATAGEPRDTQALRRVIPLYFEYRGKQVYVGKLIVVADLRGVYRGIKDGFVEILIQQTIQTFLVSMFILILFHLLLGRYLHKISKYSERLLTGSDSKPLELGRKRANESHMDELDQLVASINNMRQRLTDTFHNLNEISSRFQFIVESMPVPLALNDEQGNILYLNKTFLKTFGYTIEDIPTLNDWWPRAYPDPQYRQRVAESWQKNMEEAKRANSPFRHMVVEIMCKDGLSRIFMVIASAPQDNVSGTYLVMLYDITSQKLIEQEMRIAATAFESQESMMITDVNGVILRVNHAFTETTGYSAEEAVGQTALLLKSGRHDENFYHAIWETIHRTGSWQGEIWDRRKNGEVYPKWLTISAVKGEGGIVTNYVATHVDITERKAAEEKIHNLAFYDPLTGLPNRQLLTDRLQHALASSARSGKMGALLFIDLDNFKTLNDTLGHDIGDLLLKQVAQRLQSCTREKDTVARLGGDEFVVMLEDLGEQPHESAAQTEIISKKILATLSQPYQLTAHEHRSTSSIGATLFNGHRQTIEELLKQADIAMYQAKKAGRNAVRFFDPQMQESITGRVSLEAELRKAIDNHQFQLYYQIQMNSFLQPIGAEALIRWNHPDRGLVLPAQFITLAEENGLILFIGQWVLETACIQLKAWEQEDYTRGLVLAVNVSARQFRQADFVSQVQATVQRYAINPKLLKLELTESALLENIGDAIVTMNALKEIGVRFTLDDFGTGYSSLQYLKRLPLHQLKIDQSFVRDLAVDSSDEAIVHTIIAMAQNLNLEVIAEGVETEEQLQMLLNKGCTHYQGYLFGKPLPIGRFEALLKRG